MQHRGTHADIRSSSRLLFDNELRQELRIFEFNRDGLLSYGDAEYKCRRVFVSACLHHGLRCPLPFTEAICTYFDRTIQQYVVHLTLHN